jgi:hypothetical protein
MKLSLLILTSVFFTSCTPTYQYFTVSGNNISKNEQDEFVFENDTLRIAYRFDGYHGPVNITIYNKTNEPVEINWRKSALIYNQQAIAYYSANMSLNGVATDTIFRSRWSPTISVGDIRADIVVNEASQYIPPNSSIVKVPLNLPVSAFDRSKLDYLPRQTLKYPDGTRFRYTSLEFDERNSPALLRSYLSFATNSGKEFSIEHQFYVSGIRQAGGYYPQESENKPDRFYINP